MDGFLIIDKPTGYTSFDVVAIVRKYLKMKKVGHTGTLDPMATGVLTIAIGNATKFLQFMPAHDKEYVATLKFGVSTDTFDITGNIVAQKDVDVELKNIEKAINNFIGDIYQIPPMYSAIKVGGKRLYDLARKGEIVDRKKRLIHIKYIKILEFDKKNSELTVRVCCSKGTYIRTLVADIGELLGCGATLTSLCRTASDGFNIQDCLNIESLKKLSISDEIYDKLIPIDSIFTNFQSIQISYRQAIRFRNGGGIKISRVKVLENSSDGEIVRIYFKNEFVGLGMLDFSIGEILVLKFVQKI